MNVGKTRRTLRCRTKRSKSHKLDERFSLKTELDRQRESRMR